jgi:nucleoside-diphosphate-sugar epimerase
MHALVTGASGFVGSALVRRLITDGCRVTTLGRRPCAGGVANLEHDLGAGSRPELPAGIDAVIHLAQSRAYRSFPGDAAEMFRVNVAGTEQILEAAVAACVGTVCVASSGAVYEPFDGPMDEVAPLAPAGYLGASKLAAEILARPFAAKLRVVVLRLFHPYGPGQTARLVPDLVDRVRQRRPVTLPAVGDGLVFAPTHVDDVCDVICSSIADQWTGTYNVACRETVSIGDAARTIARALGAEPVFERGAAGAAPRIVPSLTRLGERYDLARLRSFEAGVRSMLGRD